MAGWRDPSGSLQRLHGGFVNGKGPVDMKLHFGKAFRHELTVLLFEDFYDGASLGNMASNYGYHHGGPLQNITDAQIRAALILHELRHMINQGKEAYHFDDETSSQWTKDILNACFPLKK